MSTFFSSKVICRMNRLIKFWLQINQIPRHSVYYIVWMCENATALISGGSRLLLHFYELYRNHILDTQAFLIQTYKRIFYVQNKP